MDERYFPIGATSFGPHILVASETKPSCQLRGSMRDITHWGPFRHLPGYLTRLNYRLWKNRAKVQYKSSLVAWHVQGEGIETSSVQ